MDKEIDNDKTEYFIVGIRPVKFIHFVKGGMDVLAYDWDTGEFVRNMDYLSKVFESDEADVVSEKEFNKYVEKLKNGEV